MNLHMKVDAWYARCISDAGLWCRGYVVNPFEYVNAINNTKKDIMTDDIAKEVTTLSW